MTEQQAPQLSKLNKNKVQNDTVSTWITAQNATETAAWFAKLTPSEKTLVTSEVAALCQDAGFDLSWVVEQQVQHEKLSNMLTKTVLNGLATLRDASLAQTTLKTYLTLIEWLNHLTKRKYRDQTRQIYIRLVEENVIPQAAANILLDNDKARWNHVKEELLSAYQRDAFAVEKAVRAVFLTKQTGQATTERRGLSFGRKTTPPALAPSPTG